jgi:hypothetical protein
MEGKEGHHIRFVTAYCPCQSGGASSVFQQHARAMANQQDFCNPRTAILEDLAKAMQEWKEMGDHIILGMDANEEVRRGEVLAAKSKLLEASAELKAAREKQSEDGAVSLVVGSVLTFCLSPTVTRLI